MLQVYIIIISIDPQKHIFIIEIIKVKFMKDQFLISALITMFLKYTMNMVQYPTNNNEIVTSSVKW